jgi:hypothetical protein
MGGSGNLPSRTFALPPLVFPAAMVIAVALLTPTSSLYPDQGDIGLYLEKAAAFATGQLPYRDVAFEYPPGAVVPILLPYLAWPFGRIGLDQYKLLFAGWEAFLMLVLGVTLARVVRAGGGPEPAASRGNDLRNTGVRLAVLAVGAALAITWRFDLYPSVLVIVALWAAIERRAGAAGVAIGLGILTKLYPLAVVPALALPFLMRFDFGRLLRYGGSIAATVVLGLLPFVALAGSDTFAFVRYQADRGLQIESIGGGLALLVGLLSGSPPRQSYGFSSVNVEGPFAERWLALLPAATLIGFGLIAWLGWRHLRAVRGVGIPDRDGIEPRTVVAFTTVSVLMLLVTSKVYSIQYVVWLVPLFALLPWRKFALAAAIVWLTMPIHPMLYKELVHGTILGAEVLNLRNALVVALLGWMLWSLARTRDVARPAGLEPTTFRSAT